MDRILLRDLAFFAYHGARPEERALGQRFLVDLELRLDLRAAGAADDLSLTVDYGEAYRVTREMVEGPSCQTIEAVAERVAAALLTRFPALREVVVRVSKPAAPIAGAHFGTVAVEIARSRAG